MPVFLACLKGRKCFAFSLLAHQNASCFGTGLRTNSLKMIINHFLYAPVCGTRRLVALATRFSTAAQLCTLLLSATGSGRVRFPPQGSNPFLEKQNKHPLKWMPVFLACLKGFEPLTLWFVAKYSIQLSYKHIFQMH